jgi:hypothetical protein
MRAGTPWNPRKQTDWPNPPGLPRGWVPSFLSKARYRLREEESSHKLACESNTADTSLPRTSLRLRGEQSTWHDEPLCVGSVFDCEYLAILRRRLAWSAYGSHRNVGWRVGCIPKDHTMSISYQGYPLLREVVVVLGLAIRARCALAGIQDGYGNR